MLTSNKNHATGCQPVFLVGAGRSGTTLLYKMLCLHPGVAYISNYHAATPEWFPSGALLRLIAPLPGLKRRVWFERGGNAYTPGKRPWLSRIVPGPVEGEAFYRGCGLSVSPAQNCDLSADSIRCFRRRLDAAARGTGATVLLSKRTANNQRLRWIRESVPEACFIHLIRDGRAVAYSLPRVGWWERHRIWWAGCSPEMLARTGEDPLAICARNWVMDVHAVRTGLDGIAAGRVLEVRYESLLDDPIAQLRRITDYLGLSFPGRFETAIRSVNLQKRPEAWKQNWKGEQLATVAREQDSLLRDLGYV